MGEDSYEGGGGGRQWKETRVEKGGGGDAQTVLRINCLSEKKESHAG